MIYLDHNATSPLRPEAKAAMDYAAGIGGNPSSVHGAGRAARAAVEEAHESVAKLCRVRPQDVVFTSGATEANALALWGAVYGALDAEERITRIFVSAIEHPSVLAGAQIIADRLAGIRVAEIPVTPDGVVDPESLRIMLREGKGRTLVCVMAANNETGVVQPLETIAKHVREAAALLLVDAVQAAGRIAIDIDADYLTLSAHKMGGPQGVGALVVKDGAPYAPPIAGGGQERSRRAGTENVAGIAGFGVAASLASSREGIARLGALRDHFESELSRRWPDAILFGWTAPRLCNTSNFAVPGVAAETALMALDLDGVMVSSGSACSSGKVMPSHVLKAMGVNDDVARCALRISLGWNSCEEDIAAALAALERLLSRVRPRVAA